MKPIYFNPWLTEYKQPFGAVKEGELIDFWLSVKEIETKNVSLVLKKDGDTKNQTVALTQVEEERFHICLPIEHYGLYFYYFVIEDQEARTFYGAGETAGEGAIYDSEEEVHAFQLTCFKHQEEAPKWYREGVAYQIFPDRFANGNKDKSVNHPKRNSFLYATETDDPFYVKDQNNEIVRWDFFGGNFAGIKEKIPYLKELGITVLYLNPIFEASSNHRYDTDDYLKIDPVLGTEEEFKELLDILHESGISVILDGVFSHVGKNSRYFNINGTYGEDVGAARSKDSDYYDWFTFTDYPKEYRAWWGVSDLPEVRKENTAFQKFIYGPDNSVIKKWTDLGVDGWRLDVADELPDAFIDGIRARLSDYSDKILLGEVWEDASNKISYDVRRQYVFGDNLMGVMNYPLRDQILNLLATGGEVGEACKQLIQYQENYPRDFYYNQLNNIGTHDTERILTQLNGSTKLLDQAFGLMFMMPGIPCVYYGDEAGVSGGADPDNRRFFPWQSIDENTYASCQKWIQRRTDYAVLQEGDCYPFYSEKQQIFGILRQMGSAYAIYLINLSDEDQQLRVEEFHSPRTYQGELDILQRLLDEEVLEKRGSLFLYEE